MTRRSSSFDLHVLGPPPAFVLSQDQTLRRNLGPAPPKRFRPSNQWCDSSRRGCRREFEADRDTNPVRPGTVQGWSTEVGHRCPSVQLKLFRVCPATTRDRQVDSPHWLFRPLSRFQGAPGDRRPPGTRRRPRRTRMTAVVPSTRSNDSIRTDLPLGGFPRYGSGLRRSRPTPFPWVEQRYPSRRRPPTRVTPNFAETG